MPLPPAPTKRAALLSPDAVDAPARSHAKASRRTASAEPVQRQAVMEVFDDRSATAAHPESFMEKEAASPIRTGAASYRNESAKDAD
ncbi:MAG: PhoH family protein, partial [Polaromonas sp.]|nr:PhoH family protein [Polaromonas sp.]